MAAKPYAIDTFVAQLLAPIADSEEQADTKAYRKQIKSDMERAWNFGMERIRVAEALQVVAWEAFRLSGERYVSDPTPRAVAVNKAFQALLAIELKQCLIPAPTAVQMRWKKRNVDARHQTDEIKAAIARDEARFA